MSGLVEALDSGEHLLVALAHLPVKAPSPAHITGRRSGCLCVTASGSLATNPETIAAVRWDGSADGTVAELACLDVEELRPGFTLGRGRYQGTLSSAAKVEPKVGG